MKAWFFLFTSIICWAFWGLEALASSTSGLASAAQNVKPDSVSNPNQVPSNEKVIRKGSQDPNQDALSKIKGMSQSSRVDHLLDRSLPPSKNKSSGGGVVDSGGSVEGLTEGSAIDPEILQPAIEKALRKVQSSTYPADFKIALSAELQNLYQSKRFRSVSGLAVLGNFPESESGLSMSMDHDKFYTLGGYTYLEPGALVLVSKNIIEDNAAKDSLVILLLHESLHHILGLSLSYDDDLVEALARSLFHGSDDPALQFAVKFALDLRPGAALRADQLIDFLDAGIFRHLDCGFEGRRCSFVPELEARRRHQRLVSVLKNELAGLVQLNGSVEGATPPFEPLRQLYFKRGQIYDASAVPVQTLISTISNYLAWSDYYGDFLKNLNVNPKDQSQIQSALTIRIVNFLKAAGLKSNLMDSNNPNFCRRKIYASIFYGPHHLNLNCLENESIRWGEVLVMHE